MEENAFRDLLAFFKALSDPNRLRIVALLAREALSVEQLAEMLAVSSSTVSHHLALLSRAGLVTARAESYYSIYRLETGSLAEMSQRLLAADTLPAVAADVDVDAYDRKVLNTYTTADGRISAFPVQRKKEEVLLRRVVESFEAGRRYTEKQVNRILKRFSDDTARLRRHLVEYGLMGREGGGGEYWRLERTPVA
jgi:biotin operon repressor